MKGEWKDVPEGQRWWDEALAGGIHRREESDEVGSHKVFGASDVRESFAVVGHAGLAGGFGGRTLMSACPGTRRLCSALVGRRRERRVSRLMAREGC